MGSQVILNVHKIQTTFREKTEKKKKQQKAPQIKANKPPAEQKSGFYHR